MIQSNILGVTVNTISREDILEIIEKYVKKSKVASLLKRRRASKNLVIYTPNPEIIMYANRHPYFKEIVNTGYINIPDGVGLVWAAKLLGYPIRKRIAGADLVADIVKLAVKQSVRIGIIGGKTGVALRALECLQVQFPGLRGWAEEGPEIKYEILNPKSQKIEKIVLNYGGWSMDEFVERVRREKTGVLLVGFGFPKQEIFIAQLNKRLQNVVLMAVGGGLDYLSGNIPRADGWIRDAGFEWLYRLVRQPWRLRRQLSLVEFAARVLWDKLRGVA